MRKKENPIAEIDNAIKTNEDFLLGLEPLVSSGNGNDLTLQLSVEQQPGKQDLKCTKVRALNF